MLLREDLADTKQNFDKSQVKIEEDGEDGPAKQLRLLQSKVNMLSGYKTVF